MAVLTSRLGIFGGSFNPVHLGHYEIVKAFLDHYPEDSVRIFPAGQNPFKTDGQMIDNEVRLEMVRRTFTGLKRATVDLFEIQHPYPSYTADTIAHVKKFFTGELALIMGYDCYLEFHRWQRTGYILDACSLVVFYRKGVAAVANPHVPASADITFIKADLPYISASDIQTRPKETGHMIHPDALPVWEKYCTRF